MTKRGIIEAVRLARDEGRRPLVLVRHGRTAANAARVLVGRGDPPLDAEGWSQAAAVRPELAALGPALFLTSPLLRARQTLGDLAPTAVVEALVEVDHGTLEGLPGERLTRDHAGFLSRWEADPDTTRLPGGESLGEAVARALPALQVQLDAHPAPALLVVCSHQLVIAALCCALLAEPLRTWRAYANRNTGLTLLSEGMGGWRVDLRDDLSHLAQGVPQR
jgi:broad specificity phosphatase PhoE